MARPRKTDLKLPPYVYKAKGRYIYKPWKDGRFLGEHRLCSADAPLSEVWKAYEANSAPESDPTSLRWLSGKYLESDAFTALSKSTRKQYKKHHLRICRTSLVGGGRFGDKAVTCITPGVVRRYLDHLPARVLANRQVAFMSAVFSWAYERDMVKSNPCKGVRRNKERPRDRYIEDWEYNLVHKFADPRVQVAMDLAYLCMARKQDILSLRWDQVGERGIRIRQGKTGTVQIKLWSTKLRAVIERARALPASVSSMYVIHNRHGQLQKEKRFYNLFWAARHKALQNGLQRSFTFHDIKARGISDYKGDKMMASGHKTPAMVARYDRKPQEVDPTE